MVQREAVEEAGCELTTLLPICHYWSSPGACSEKVALFCAKVDATNAGGIFGLDEEHEDIRVIAVDTSKAFEAVANGDINNAASIIALQWLQLRYRDVKKLFL